MNIKEEQALQLVQTLFHLHYGDNAAHNVNEQFISVLRTLVPEVFCGDSLGRTTIERSDVNLTRFIAFLRIWAVALEGAASEEF